MSEIVEQGTDEWLRLRAGKITASEFCSVIGSKGAREKYLHQIAFERLSDTPVHEVNSPSLRWGTEIETFAREAYELRTGNFVDRAGFIVHPVYPFAGYSADGFVDGDGLVEIKSPHDEAVHIRTWACGMPDEHKPQCQGGLWVTGRQWLDFISYDPRMVRSVKHRLYVQRIYRDEIYIAKLAAAIIEFNEEVKEIIQLLEERAA